MESCALSDADAQASKCLLFLVVKVSVAEMPQKLCI